jgi:hypothetical protein
LQRRSYCRASVYTCIAPLRAAGKLVMGVGIVWFSLASALLPAAAITPWTAAAGLTLPAVLAARFLVGFGEGELPRSQPRLSAMLKNLESCSMSSGWPSDSWVTDRAGLLLDRRGAAGDEQPCGPQH